MLPSVSVIICSHNGRLRLSTTLDHLAAQQLPAGLDWEIILVDNGSTDGTGGFASQYVSVHGNLPLVVVYEDRLGLVHARLKSYQVASKEIIVFVDDDNWLDHNYVRYVAELMSAHPQIGGLGGYSDGAFESEPPPWFEAYRRWYAISGPPDGCNELTETDFLWGAGAAYRRVYIQRIMSSHINLVTVGRQGTSLTGGDDHELSYLLRLCGARLFVT